MITGLTPASISRPNSSSVLQADLSSVNMASFDVSESLNNPSPRETEKRCHIPLITSGIGNLRNLSPSLRTSSFTSSQGMHSLILPSVAPLGSLIPPS